MYTLVKIRTLYLKRHKIKFCINYLFLPLILFLITFSSEPAKYKSIIPELNIDPDSEYFEFKEIKEIQTYKKNIVRILTNNRNLSEKFVNTSKKYSINPLNFEIYEDYSLLSKQNIYSNDSMIEIKEEKNNVIIFRIKDDSLKLRDLEEINSQLSIPSNSMGLNENMKAILPYYQLIYNFLLEENKITPTKKISGIMKATQSNNRKDKSTVASYYLTPIFITFIYSVLFLDFCFRMIYEKQGKLDKFLNRQGIKKFDFFISWFLTYIVLSSFSTIIILYFLIKLIFEIPNYSLLIITQILFSLSNFAMSFFIQTISTSIKLGQTLFFVLYLGTGLLSIPISLPNASRFFKIIMLIFPQINQLFNTQILIHFQLYINYDFNCIFFDYNGVTFFETLLFYLIDLFLYIFGSFFILNYRESGLPLLQYIFSSFWGKARKIEENGNLYQDDSLDLIVTNHEELTEYNKSLKETNSMLNIQNVTRIYNDVIAVNDFKGEMFPGEIFCLLGHNGAGKTTLIKMISGIEDPDNGDIFLNGTSLITNKDYLYKNIGLCEQEDIFFDYLTVEEHLKYMQELKGERSNEREIDDLLRRIGLLEKNKSLCKELSGGQKRKLCIALALIGNSQLVLLDEPTSGMDVIAKKALWEFLRGYKKDKIIILTTHSLDEAEYLGDRIGIMSMGKFICSGTSSFLKEKYPSGYNLNLIIDSKKFNHQMKNSFINEIKKLDFNTNVKIASKGVLSLNFPKVNDKIKDIFNFIDNNKNNYSIKDYTVSTTTLENVFLKLNTSSNVTNELNEELQVQLHPILLNYESSPFLIQLYQNIQRNFIPIWENKFNFILDLLSSLLILIVYVLIFSSIAGGDKSTYKDFKTLLTGRNKIYITKNIENFLKNSTYINYFNLKIPFQNINYTHSNNDTINNFTQKVLSLSKYYNEKLLIDLYKENEDYIFNILFQKNAEEYSLSALSLLFSNFLNKEYNIKVIIIDELSNMPSKVNEIKKISSGEIFSFISLLFIFFSLVLYGGVALAPIVRERCNKLKHMLYLSGGNMWAYWLGFLVVDLFKYFILFLCMFLCMINFSTKYFIALIPLFICYAISITLFIYVFSFLIDKEDQALKSYIILCVAIFIIIPNVFGLLLTPITIIFFDIIQKNFFSPWFITYYEFCPISSLLFALIRIVIVLILELFTKDVTEPSIPSSSQLIFIHCMYLLCEGLIWGLLLILAENKVLNRLFQKCIQKCCCSKGLEFSTEEPVIDPYLAINNNETPNDFQYQINENSLTPNNNINNNVTFSNTSLQPLIENNINQTSMLNNVPINNNNYIQGVNPYIQNEILKINSSQNLTTTIINLTKTYFKCCKKSLRAVNNLYLGLESNEKFGLLGFNGSGKSTTFKCITNELIYEEGSINLFGNDTLNSFENIRTAIGYCPQENPLFDFLTVKQTLEFYKSLKKSEVPIEEVCKKFNLEKYINKYCGNLSGGNKRKLTFAISLMNNPKILLLDEPSTGVDPESRRIMWKNINELSKNQNQYNMILSTHSMEEAEILCDTVSWLRSGNFICIGNPEELKIKFSAGYKLHIKFNDKKLNNDFNYIFKLSDIGVEGGHFIDNFVMQNQHLIKYVNELFLVLNDFKDSCEKIRINQIGSDFSFDLMIYLRKDKQGDAFSHILNMKQKNEKLSEININIESLENILTKL